MLWPLKEVDYTEILSPVNQPDLLIKYLKTELAIYFKEVSAQFEQHTKNFQPGLKR